VDSGATRELTHFRSENLLCSAVEAVGLQGAISCDCWGLVSTIGRGLLPRARRQRQRGSRQSQEAFSRFLQLPNAAHTRPALKPKIECNTLNYERARSPGKAWSMSCKGWSSPGIAKPPTTPPSSTHTFVQSHVFLKFPYVPRRQLFLSFSWFSSSLCCLCARGTGFACVARACLCLCCCSLAVHPLPPRAHARDTLVI
jgi:hypothetical protein